MTRTAPLSRRTALKLTGTAALAGLAGCLGSADTGPAGVVLDAPDNYEALQEADLPYPIHGEDVPEATVPDVLRNEDVSTRGFVGESAMLLTFVYTRCEGICQSLGANLVQVQARAAEWGVSDDVALTAISFDPEYDTPERFRSWGANRGLDYDLDNAHLLRPESPARARTVVEDTFGEAYEANDKKGMPFLHTGLILLVNDGGVVERAYAGEPPQPKTVVEDVQTLLGV
ncbi:SCO family protein [Halobacteriales archaeon Cl-PHB]